MRPSERIADKFRKAQAAQVGYRGDLHLADYRKLTKRTAQVLIAFDKGCTVPSKQDVHTFVAKSFGSAVLPMLKTAEYHSGASAVSVVVCQNTETRPLEDSKDMHETILSTQYQDTRTAEVWNVEEVDGAKVLIRQSDDDIEAILKARKHLKTATVSFSEIRTAGVAHMDSGDLVEFYDRDSLYKGIVHRIVKSVTGDRVVVEQDGEMKDVPIESVMKVIPSDVSLQSQQQILYDYYKKIYGEEYAKQLVSM